MSESLTYQLLDAAEVPRVAPEQTDAVEHRPDERLRVGKLRRFERLEVLD